MLRWWLPEIYLLYQRPRVSLRIATCCRGTPAPIKRPACAYCSNVSFGRRPPLHPLSLVASSPARVLSTINSRSISSSVPMTWKKNRPIGVDVSMLLSVRLWKLTPRSRNSSTRTTRWRILWPRRSSFHTTSVSPSDNVLTKRSRLHGLDLSNKARSECFPWGWIRKRPRKCAAFMVRVLILRGTPSNKPLTIVRSLKECFGVTVSAALLPRTTFPQMLKIQSQNPLQ